MHFYVSSSDKPYGRCLKISADRGFQQLTFDSPMNKQLACKIPVASLTGQARV